MTGLGNFWGRFRRRRSALVGLGLLFAVMLMAVLGPLLVPGSPWEIIGTPFTWSGRAPAR